MALIPDKLTTVVNYWPDLPTFPGRPSSGERYIGREPIYRLDSVKKLAQQSIFIVTEKAEANVSDLAWDDDDICTAVLTLKSSQFRTATWCEMSAGKWIPCDDYVVRNLEYHNLSGRRSSLFRATLLPSRI